MKSEIIKNMIYYSTEDDKNIFKYKKIDATSVDEVKYEDGMLNFKFLKYFSIIVADKEYFVKISESKRLFIFGEKFTVDEILSKINNGEISESYKEIMLDLKNRYSGDELFLVTGRKNIERDTNFNNIIVKEVFPTTPDLDINKSDFITPKIEWYVEYKKGTEIICEPTLYSDKKFRSGEVGTSYRFIRIAKFEINGILYERVIEREDEIHVVEQTYINDEVEEALDGAKRLLYKSHEESELFEGYTRIYPFNTEDSSSVFRIQQDKIKNQNVATITGSGDAQLDLFLYGASKATCFDINRLAKFYASLKFSFIKAGMSYEEYVSYFFNNNRHILDKRLYDKYKYCLTSDIGRFWDGIYEYLDNNDLELTNDENNLFYNIYGMFGTGNKSYNNESSYFTPKNYVKLQEILKMKTLKDVIFIDSSLFDIHNKIENQHFGYIYLSNIIDFTSLYFDDEEDSKRYMLFKQFILDNLSSILKEEGTIDVGFVSRHWADNKTINTYNIVFTTEEGFCLKNLEPYNFEDKVLTYQSLNLENTKPHVYKH